MSPENDHLEEASTSLQNRRFHQKKGSQNFILKQFCQNKGENMGFGSPDVANCAFAPTRGEQGKRKK